MSVREAKASDLDAVALLCSKGMLRVCCNDPGSQKLMLAAFYDDELVGDIMHPHRDQYPEDFTNYFRRKCECNGKDNSHYAIVSFKVNPDGSETITGFADWVRQREGAGCHSAKDPGKASGEPPCLGSNESSYVPDVSQNRAADPKQTDIFDRSALFTQHYWSGARAETWYLDLLAVHPDHRRKGYGGLLVKWGVGKARNENVSASVVASQMGESIYRSCGFEPVGWASEGEGNPLAGIPGGRIMFIDAV